MDLVAIDENEPGGQWLARFHEVWPAYRRWLGDWRGDGCAGKEALARHMPELLATHRAACTLAGDDPWTSAVLAGWALPSPFAPGCSVAVVDGPEPGMVRNYDFDPELFEGTIRRTQWCRPVLAVSELLLGALDGINDAGLVVALTFGGRFVHGTGFAVPLIVRYLLETCTTVQQAVATARLLPCATSQNLLILDREGRFATVVLAPDRPAEVIDAACVTNHAPDDAWLPEPDPTRSLRRIRELRELRRQGASVGMSAERFLRPPIHFAGPDEPMQTLYTVVYRPADGSADFLWPDGRWSQAIDRFTPGRRRCGYDFKGGQAS